MKDKQANHCSRQGSKVQTFSNYITITLPIHWHRGNNGKIILTFFKPKSINQITDVARKPSVFQRALNIQKLMHEKQWTQAEVARHLGYTRARICQILKILKIPKPLLEELQAEGSLTERRIRDIS